jgi:hypothetical protein
MQVVPDLQQFSRINGKLKVKNDKSGYSKEGNSKYYYL